MVWADKPRAAKKPEQTPRARPRKVRRVLIATPDRSMNERAERDRRAQISLRENDRKREV
jgi:hypothetical protein